MSPAAVSRLTRHERHICRQCHAHRARFRYRGLVKADRDHTLCFRCYRSELEKARARRLREISAPMPLKMELARPVERVRTRDLIARA